MVLHVGPLFKRLLKFIVFCGLGQFTENLYELIPSAVEVSEFLKLDLAESTTSRSPVGRTPRFRQRMTPIPSLMQSGLLFCDGSPT
jgi:hypothetical protein